jgi:hypothetical protein
MKELEGHLILNDSEFERQVANCTLNPSLFTHESRLRLAWLHIHRYGIEKAIENVSSQLLSYASILGINYTYNKTMTRAALHTVYHFKRQSRSKNFADFILEFPELKFNFKELTGFHYANDTFNSIHERYEFDYVEPEFALAR